jgi:hypothetical protein
LGRTPRLGFRLFEGWNREERKRLRGTRYSAGCLA